MSNDCIHEWGWDTKGVFWYCLRCSENITPSEIMQRFYTMSCAFSLLSREVQEMSQHMTSLIDKMERDLKGVNVIG